MQLRVKTRCKVCTGVQPLGLASAYLRMSLEGIFIDLYGTITAGDRAAVEAVCTEIVRDSGIAMTAHELSITWGERFFASLDGCNGDAFLTLFEIEMKTLRQTMAPLGVAIDPEPYCRILQQYWQNPPLHDEAKQALDDLGYPICIVSNADHADAEAVVARHGLRVDYIVTSELARSYKPDGVIFGAAMRQTGWRRERVIHVGDSLHSDIGGAIRAGLRNVWINRVHRIHDIGTEQPDHEIPDLAGLSSLVGFRSAGAAVGPSADRSGA